VSILQIKNVPEPVHAELRRRAAQAHQSVRDYVLALIERDQLQPTMADWLDSVALDPPVELSGSTADAVRAARDERDAELVPSPGHDRRR
jgi:plasmid stability protein